MKHINFQRGNSMLRVWEQDQKGRTPFNWDRLIYIVILIVVLFFFLRYVWHKTFYIEANGQVHFENVNIMNTQVSRILKFHIEEGDIVHKGDSLFTYFRDDAAFENYSRGGSATVNISGDQSTGWIDREIYSLTKQIATSEIRLKEQTAMLELYTAQLEKTRNEVILEIVSRNKLDELESKIEGLRFDQEKTLNEIKMNREFLAKMQQMKSQELSISMSADGKGVGSPDGKIVFYSPLSGSVTRINFQPFEVAQISEVILTIHKPENIFVKGYFEQEDLEELHEGDIVHVQFPDGTNTRGIIKRFYFATLKLPEELQKKYESTTRSLIADIYPLDSTELNKWKVYYKMDVRIFKSVY